MGAISALSRTGDALQRNPILFAAGAIVALEGAVVSTGYQLPVGGVLVGGFLSLVFLFVEPFLAGGLLGMGSGALGGSTDFDRFVDAGKEYYTRLLGARLLTIGVTIAYWLVGAVVMVVLVVFVAGFQGGSGGPAAGAPSPTPGVDPLALVLLLGGALFFVLLYYAAGFLVQFHPAAIVLEDEGLIDSFKRSYRVVRSEPLSALGYSVIVRFLGTVIGGIPAFYFAFSREFGAMMVESPEAAVGMSVANLAVFFVLTLVLQALLLPLLRVYHLSVYGELAV